LVNCLRVIPHSDQSKSLVRLLKPLVTDQWNSYLKIKKGKANNKSFPERVSPLNPLGIGGVST